MQRDQHTFDPFENGMITSLLGSVAESLLFGPARAQRLPTVEPELLFPDLRQAQLTNIDNTGDKHPPQVLSRSGTPRPTASFSAGVLPLESLAPRGEGSLR